MLVLVSSQGVVGEYIKANGVPQGGEETAEMVNH
jgi:hypothetical protein